MEAFSLDGPLIQSWRDRALRRRPHLAVGCVAAGLALAPAGVPAVAALAGAAGAAAAVLFARPAAVAAAVCLAGAAGLFGAARLGAIDRPADDAPPGSVIAAAATLLEHPRPARFGSTAAMRIETGPARGLRIMARLGSGALRHGTRGPGARFRVRALVLRDAAAQDGEFDYAAFLRSRGIARQARVTSMRFIGRRGGVSGFVDGVRRRAERGMTAGLPEEKAALARGMVLGQDGGISEEVQDDFQRSGLAHLLAASGANVALLCALAIPFLAALRAPPPVRIAAMLALVALYVPLAGSGASIERAGIMAAAGLVAVAAGRPASAVYALLLAAALTLGLNPRATGDPSWQLSFAAVAGMLALGPPVQRLLAALPRAVAEPLCVTIAATVATAPLMAHQFGAISIAALPANVLALPAVAPVMWIGMTQAAIGQAAALAGPAGAAAAPLCEAAGLASGAAIGWVAGVARTLAQPQWAQAQVALSAPATGVAYAVVLGLAAVAVRTPMIPPTRATLAIRWRVMPPWARAAVVIAGLGALAAGVIHTRPPGPPRHLTVNYIDVGQGDATLIRDPTGAAVLFDGGPPEGRVDRTLWRLGVRRLSAVVATHASRDHQGGLLQVVKRFPVGVFVDGGDGTSDPAFRRVASEARRRGARTVPSRAGLRLRAGTLDIEVLSPPDRPPGPAPDDPNPRATVAIVRSGEFDLFLSADAESPYLLPLTLPRVDAMKVPHHGSEDPGLDRLLERLRPAVAAIEVGEGNPFGHPRRSTLESLARHVPHVFRTDRDGTIELTVEGGAMRVRTHR